MSTAQVHDDRVKVTQNNKSLKENIETGKERKWDENSSDQFGGQQIKQSLLGILSNCVMMFNGK